MGVKKGVIRDPSRASPGNSRPAREARQSRQRYAGHQRADCNNPVTISPLLRPARLATDTLFLRPVRWHTHAMSILSVAHACIKTTSLEQTAAFYCDGLGMKKWPDPAGGTLHN